MDEMSEIHSGTESWFEPGLDPRLRLWTPSPVLSLFLQLGDRGRRHFMGGEGGLGFSPVLLVPPLYTPPHGNTTFQGLLGCIRL